MTTRSQPENGFNPNRVLAVEQSKDETGAQAVARMVLKPQLRHAHTASMFAEHLLGSGVEQPGIMDFVDHVQSATKLAEAGSLSGVSAILAAHAITLDSMFTEFARRAALNMGSYPDAADRYARLSMKAQSSCRATLEALAKLHQPREQTVRHVHVNEGGQAVIADEFHNHAGGNKNAKRSKQSHATRCTAACRSLPSPHSEGNTVSIFNRKRKRAL
ncbi:hypothetical protein [Sphingomonas arenae]|uniref:hypothetical protein n=1 Tax=Sphingomonas arenae TaxID=2812555 RepID=UPI0019686058|nr:hypothetical protein [Sphingomonas arenae]